MKNKLSPFDFIKSINKKNYLMVDEHIEKQYDPFIVNRGLSFFIDCVPFVYNMNRYCNLPKKIQYDYLFTGIRKKDRWSKWAKDDKYEYVDEIMKEYSVNKSRAIEILDRLSKEQVDSIIKRQNAFGGRA